ncbi:MAG: bifunctional adenosylcobinamide kinase/adenosylcobinamide-phosphate guanylyltransferase [Aestuariivita sp.]|nr:bifunctional adenosylcobinamide kinase/adenosylcobinamide-phosphate guanylyltransferase [Aestuariivita sp.]
MLPKLTLVLGGAASGKSRFAENLAKREGKSVIYIATAQTLDDEMKQKAERHQSRRPKAWTTIEEPYHAAHTLRTLSESVVLFECATLWLSNHILKNDSDLVAERIFLLESLRHCPASVIMVSNEVGHGLVPEYSLGRTFREEQGHLNIALADQANSVIAITAGLPHVLKTPV